MARRIHICPPWLSWMLVNPLRRMVQGPERTMRPFVRPGDTVADIGCGPGFFTAALARLVGERGSVVAVDVQPEMLERTRAHVGKSGLEDRVRLHLARPDGLDLPPGSIDLAVAFWMVHEVPDKEGLLKDILAGLAPGGALLMVEPRLHVHGRDFDGIVRDAKAAGFAPPVRARILMSRAALFRKPGAR